MEPKKNPKYDVHRKRGVLLNVGLLVSLILVITAFKWTVPMEHVSIDLSFQDNEFDPLLADVLPSTTFKQDPPIEPRRIQPTVPTPAPNFIEISNNPLIESPTPGIDQDVPAPDLNVGSFELPPEKTPEPDTFRIVERMPEPVGGWETFYKTLKKHIKYPKTAERIGAKGKVFVEFTVNNKGDLSHFKIIKGVGHGCDEEAQRVIALTKWKAGKQRGRPVNVRMVQPITFSLNN